jgi:hypothetical protein
MLSGAAVICPDAAQDPAVVAGHLQQEVSADSLWGDLGQLNFEALDNWEEPEYVDIEGLVEQLVRPTGQPIIPDQGSILLQQQQQQQQQLLLLLYIQYITLCRQLFLERQQ